MPANSVIQLRRGTAAQWTSANPVLANGEPGYETDTGKEKRGDGTTAWTSLAYLGSGAYAPVSADWTGGATGAISRTLAAKLKGFTDVKDFGAVGDGSTDDTAHLATAMAAGIPLRFTAGTYLTSAPVVQPDISVVFDAGVTIKATASMSALWQVGTASVRPSRRSLRGNGGVLDCNNLASIGFYPFNFGHFEAQGLNVSKTALHGIVVGDPSASFTSYECHLDQVHTIRGSTDSVPSGGRGLWVRLATDGEFNRMDLVGNDIGCRVDTDSNRFVQVHPWGYSGHLPTICFDDQANRNAYIGCEADSPSVYGWQLGGVQTVFFGGRVFLNSFVTDNTVIGVTSGQATPAFLASGLKFVGSTSHRMAQDFGGTGGVNGCTILRADSTNVVTVVANGDIFGGTPTFKQRLGVVSTDAAAAFFRDGSSTTIFNINTSSKVIGFGNNTGLFGYSDNLSTATVGMRAVRGTLQPGTVAGLGVEIYSGTGAPALFANLNDMYIRKDGGAGTWLYRCTTANSATTGAWTTML